MHKQKQRIRASCLNVFKRPYLSSLPLQSHSSLLWLPDFIIIKWLFPSRNSSKRLSNKSAFCWVRIVLKWTCRYVRGRVWVIWMGKAPSTGHTQEQQSNGWRVTDGCRMDTEREECLNMHITLLFISLSNGLLRKLTLKRSSKKLSMYITVQLSATDWTDYMCHSSFCLGSKRLYMCNRTFYPEIHTCKSPFRYLRF